MPRPEPTPVTRNQWGADQHPSFGVCVVHRVHAQPGVSLFDSSIRHNEYVELSFHQATRDREDGYDRVHHSPRPLIEVSMSLSQWGALVSSFGNGNGQPVTITSLAGRAVPNPADDEPPLAATARHVGEAASRANASVVAAQRLVQDAFDRKAGRREMQDALRSLQVAVENVPSNMRHAAQQMTDHTERVVTKARADIEGMAARAAAAGVQIDQADVTLQLTTGEPQ